MTVQSRFDLPAPDASREALEEALAALNAIRLHEDHIRHGFGFLIAEDFERPGVAAGRLLAFASAEGLYPADAADAAAQAIAIRAGWLHACLEAGGDPEADWGYAHFAYCPIALVDIGWLEGVGEALDDEIPW